MELDEESSSSEEENTQRDREEPNSSGEIKEVGVKRPYQHDYREVRRMEVVESSATSDVLVEPPIKRQKESSIIVLNHPILPAPRFPNIIGKNQQGNALFLDERLTYKITRLKERSLSFIRVFYRRTSIHIDIFDDNSAPVLNRQIIRVACDNTLVCLRLIKELIMTESVGREDIKIPQIVITEDEMNILLCPLKECNEGFLEANDAKNHVLSHLDLRPFGCNYAGCNWTFSKESHFQRHVATHDNIKNYPCDELGCDKLFTTIYNLREHKKRRHIQPATKPCPVSSCKDMFRNGKELRTHCKQHDRTEAPHKCDFIGCKRSFFFKTTFEAHCKTHLIENQHICHYNNCNKTFQQAYRLKEHMRCHTGAKPYKCTIGKCTKDFSTASKLTRHEISHFDNKNHYCNVEGCDKAFKRSDHLNKHIKQIHNVVAQGQRGFPRPSTSAAVSSRCAVHDYKFVEDIPQVKVIVTSEPSTSGSHTTAADEVADLSNISDIAGGSSTYDEILAAAIQSIRVPEIITENELFLNEPLADMSTVNLGDLQ